MFVSDSTDFLGINYYFSLRVCDRKMEPSDHMKNYTRMTDVGVVLDYDPSWEMLVLETSISIEWPESSRINGPSKWLSNVPDGFGNLLTKLSTEYQNIPILITENGAMDAVDEEGINDVSRIRYLSGHLAEVSKGGLPSTLTDFLINRFQPSKEGSI